MLNFSRRWWQHDSEETSKPSNQPGPSGIRPVLFAALVQILLGNILVYTRSPRRALLSCHNGGPPLLFLTTGRVLCMTPRTFVLLIRLQYQQRLRKFLIKTGGVPYHLQYYRSLQHGFVMGRILLACQFDILNLVTPGADSHRPMLVYFPDMSKAFGRVFQSQPMAKIEACGLGNALLSCLSSYLSAYFQAVNINGWFSRPYAIISEVNQGAILHPLKLPLRFTHT